MRSLDDEGYDDQHSDQYDQMSEMMYNIFLALCSNPAIVSVMQKPTGIVAGGNGSAEYAPFVQPFLPDLVVHLLYVWQVTTNKVGMDNFGINIDGDFAREVLQSIASKMNGNGNMSKN